MMPTLLAALPTWQHVVQCPTFWALAVGALGLWQLLPMRGVYGRRLGGVLMAVAGALFAYDLPRLGPWPTIVAIGVAFGLYHGLVEALPELALFGSALAWLRWKTGSVFPGMLAHATFNAIGLLSVFF